MKSLCLAVATVSMAAICVGCGGGGGGGSSTPVVVVPPTNTNSAPILSMANSDQVGTAGAVYSYDATQSGATFTDADGDSLTYSVEFGPSGSGLSADNGMISGTPAAPGTVTVTITASDGNGGQVSDVFDIVINVASTGTKPNIVFVITDDQGKDASAEYTLSQDTPNTPNFSALANNGVIFDNLWVSPTCSPTRAALISGKYGHETNVLSPGDPLPAQEVILQSFLKSDSATSDYASALIGKWHLGGGQSGPNDFGLDYFAGIIGGGVSDYYNWNLNENGTTTTSTNYTTTELTTLAIDWVDNQTQPWFLWLSYNAPHTPFHLPPTSLHTRSLSGTQADINAQPREYYLASIEALDTEFGRFWNSLSVAEQDNTIVIYIGDNGTPGQVIDRTVEQRGNKGSLYQGGVNTPMFVSGAGISRVGEREDALVTHTDFFPTIVELAGGTLSSYQDGQSFYNLLTGNSAIERGFSYTNNVNGWTVRNGTNKLVQNTNGSQELFDLINDPAEADDLITGTSDTTAILMELTDEADRILGATNITGVKFSDMSPLCSHYVGRYRSLANDIQQGTQFQGDLEISADSNQCVLSSNSIPNHDFNDGTPGFPNDVGEVNESFEIPLIPAFAGAPTALTIDRDNAILLNGVKVDVLAAACFGVGDERTGCGNINQPWRFDPMHGPNGFNVDTRNAHAQPDGAYHYHGPPPVSNGDANTISGVIGFAADGFPIFGPFFDANGVIRQATSSYSLRAGSRPDGTGEPGGTYDGTFRDDYEYIAGQGDLDECNGMTIAGQYGYYVTDNFPYVVGCFSGTPDPSFLK